MQTKNSIREDVANFWVDFLIRTPSSWLLFRCHGDKVLEVGIRKGMISTSSWVLRFVLGDLGDTHLLVRQWSRWRRRYLWNNILTVPNFPPYCFIFIHSFWQSNVLVAWHPNFWVMCGERAWLFMPGIVFVHRKGMDFKVRHGLCKEKGHDLLVEAWSLYIERAWFTNSSIIPSHHSIFHSCFFVHCLSSHQDGCWSGIVCAHP